MYGKHVHNEIIREQMRKFTVQKFLGQIFEIHKRENQYCDEINQIRALTINARILYLHVYANYLFHFSTNARCIMYIHKLMYI